MKIKSILNFGALAVCAAAVAAPMTGCSNSKTDKTAAEAAEQPAETTEVTDSKLSDGLYTPANVEEGKTYPLIVVIEDEAGATADVFTADDFQAETPSYVYIGSDVQGIIDANAVDAARVYSVGNTPDSDVYAASLIVDSAAPKDLKDRKAIFFYTTAEPVNAVEEALRGSGVGYTYAEWGADLPVERQSELAATMLEKGKDVNVFQFEAGTVTAENAPAAAAAIPAVRNWLLAQKK